MGMWISLIYGVAMFPLMFWSEPILRAIGQDPHVSQLAQAYLRIAYWGIFPALMVMVLKNYLSGLERAGIVLWITLLTLVANGILNYALIFGNWGAPELGVRGAATASVLVQLIGFIVLVIYIHKKLPEHAMFQRFWISDREARGMSFAWGGPLV